MGDMINLFVYSW